MKIEEFHYVLVGYKNTVHLLWKWTDDKTKCGIWLGDRRTWFEHDYEKVKDGPFCKNCLKALPG